MPDTVKFFNRESTFSKMKKTAVFMNIGRGTTCDEQDLANALNEGIICGGVLDVYAVEPLPQENPLWDCKNLVMYPHCADRDVDYDLHCIKQLAVNIANCAQGKPLINITNKKLGY